MPVAGLRSTPYHLPSPSGAGAAISSMPVTLSTRVVSARSKAGDLPAVMAPVAGGWAGQWGSGGGTHRLVLDSSKPLKSSPRHCDTLLHMNSHMLTHESGSTPGVWLLSCGLPGKGTKAIGRGG